MTPTWVDVTATGWEPDQQIDGRNHTGHADNKLADRIVAAVGHKHSAGRGARERLHSWTPARWSGLR